MEAFRDALDEIRDAEDLEVMERLFAAEALAANRCVRRQKTHPPRFDPFVIEEGDFKRKYRFTKAYVRSIVDLLRDDSLGDPRGGTISPELQVMSALRTWARAEVHDDRADLHGFSQRTVSTIYRRVGRALAAKSNQFIKMPEDLAEQQRVIAGFRDPGVIGAIDRTHIRILKVGGDASQMYINRKNYFSLNAQVVCDSSLRIRNIVAHWRGSVHDSRIFNESTLKMHMETGVFRGRLLGDSGYACTPYLFTPILRPGSAQERYNYAHIRTRNTIERCFGLWKQRFRVPLKGFTGSLENAKTSIVALAALHNIAIDMKEEGSTIENVLRENIDMREFEAEEAIPAAVNGVRGPARREKI